MNIEFETEKTKSEVRKNVILDGLNEEQQAAVKDYENFVVILAGAGAGKTKTLVRRAAYMIENNIPASSILLFTFTKKAAKEIQERIESFMGDKAAGVTVSTYHSFCARQLRRYASYAGYHDNFSIIDDEAQKKVISKALKDANSNTKPEIILSLISFFKDKHLTPKQAAAKYADDSEYAEAVQIYEVYQKTLRKNNSMDFDDLLFNMTSILEQNDFVRQQMHNRFRWITADESQDSSVLDLKFIFLLTNPSTMNLCLVGDDNQSIYAFRGADVGHFAQTIAKYPHKTHILNKNYRSTPQIVNAAESLIKYNPQLVKKDIKSMQASGDLVLNLQSRNQVHEADQITSIIQNGVKAGELKYDQVAILFRNTYLTRNVENAFIHAGIPYEIVSGVSFYDRKEVKDIISYLDFIVNPENLLSLERVLCVPKRGLGQKSIEKILCLTSQKYSSYAIIDMKDAISVLKEIEEECSGRIGTSLSCFTKEIEELCQYAESSDVTPVKVIDKLISLIDYENYLRKYDPETYDQRLLNITELKNMAGTYTSLDEFLSDVVTSKSDSNTKDENNKVHLMTMHASKGLEFRLVIIADAIDGIIPSWRCQSEKDRQEERRLFYVAMTRAKENLVICHPESVLRKGRPEFVRPSSFISQISSEYLQDIAG